MDTRASRNRKVAEGNYASGCMGRTSKREGSRKPGPAPWTTPPGWVEPIEAYTIHLQVKGASADTLRLRTHHVQRVARALDVASPAEVTKHELFKWVGAQKWSTETRRSYYATLRAFWAVAIREGHAHNDIAAELPTVKMTEPEARPTPHRVYRAALKGAEPRERLMLRLSAEAGMRRGEVSRGHSSDLIEDDDGFWIRVHGKGGKQRLVPILDDLAAELSALGRGYFFPSRHPSGHLSAGHVGVLISRALGDEYTMHQLRHMFGTRTYRVKRDVFVVQELLGHASPATTRRYVKIPREDLRSTVVAAAS